jgi:hypothetical protein
MQAERSTGLELDELYVDSVADPADLQERSRSPDHANPRNVLYIQSGRRRAVSDGLGSTTDTGSMG